MPEALGPTPYEVWPAANDDTLAGLHVVQARDAVGAANTYIERYLDDLDWPEAIRVRVQPSDRDFPTRLEWPEAIRVRVRRPSDLNQLIRTFDVRVSFVPIAEAFEVREEVPRG